MRIRAMSATAVAVLMSVGVLAACSNDKKVTPRVVRTCPNGDGPWGWCGSAKNGYLAPNQPDVNPGTNGGKRSSSSAS